MRRILYYNGYFVNGYVFHTEAYGLHKSTANWGVCVRGSNYGLDEISYYGILEEVLEIFYHNREHSIVLFKCRWFDPYRGVITNKRTGITEIRKDFILSGDDVFVFASQCNQVYYTEIPSRSRERSGYWAVVNAKPRGRVEVPICSNKQPDEDVFQAEVMETAEIIEENYQLHVADCPIMPT